MNTDFLKIIGANPEDRRGVFLATATRLGMPLQNVEKDFWVCWILDLLFNERDPHEPRLLFKGGTSLSKAYALISRFSEDLDITVFREDIGQNIAMSDLEGKSGKQQRIQLDKIKQASQQYIQGALKERLNRQITTVFNEINASFDAIPVIQDLTDLQQQTLLVRYPTVSTAADYIIPTIKIEGGAKSALDPHRIVSIKPYMAEEMHAANLWVPGIVTIDAERTFWDKIMILHGLRSWHDHRGQLRHEGHRISRHYYDIYKLMHSGIGQKAQTDYTLALDCARHARLFFNSPDLNLQYACPGLFSIVPTPKMHEALSRDYRAMSGMIFGEIPEFSDVISAIKELEYELNQ